MDKRGKGQYLGTEIDEKWWKRYRRDGLFLRGNGEYWHDDKGFYFRRYLTREPFFIPFDALLETKLGKWHCGRWACGNPIVKMMWQKDGLRLSSGFVVSRREGTAIALKETIDERRRVG